ncbi:hypothetical protein CDIF27640_03518 [Clostridioides difficile]|nr:hypothetical protein CDIF27638_03518 [Clostridioides difficile]AXB69968.1 hypothetical protein CDIF27640_03518 [Clostridioides difficile]
MLQKIEPLVETVYRAALGVGFFSFLRVGPAFGCDLIHKGIHHSGFRIEHGHRRRLHILRDLRPVQDVIGKAKFHRLVRVHPGLGIHQMGEFSAGQTGLDFVGVDDGILDAAKHLDGFLHLCGIAHGNGHRVVDHHHGHRRYQHLRAGHGNDRGGAGCDAIDLYGHIMGVIHEHIVDLRRRHTVPAWGVDPDGDIAVPGHQFLLKKLRRDVIVKPAFLGDGAVQEQRPFRRSCLRCCLVLPLPELLHRGFPPFPFVYLQKHPHFPAGAYCR